MQAGEKPLDHATRHQLDAAELRDVVGIEKIDALTVYQCECEL